MSGKPNSGERQTVAYNTESFKSVENLEGQSFNIKIVIPGSETFTLEVASNEIVQEIHRALMDREESCHRTCFSLQFNNETLDLYTDLKSVAGLKDGSEVRVVEDRYSALEARNHVKHILEILNSLKPFDAYAGKDNLSLTFLNVVTGGELIPQKSTDDLVFKVPDYIKPKSDASEPPLTPLHPINETDSNLTCLKQLVFSNWNPPSAARRLAGDLLYLVVTFLEGKRCHITASTKGFFVNQSSDDEFNPKPLQNAHALHSLVDLLKVLSPQFKKNFETILKKRAKKSAFERYPVPYRVNSWLSPSWPHTADSLRKEEAFAIRLAFEENLPGMTRDWNDELQATRALTDNELLRDRAVFKSNSDFVASSVRTAMNVVNGEVPAINPGEKRRQQMFIWNNMFLSLGFDVKEHYEELGGDAAAYRATNCDLNGVKAYSKLPYNGLCTLGTALIDYLGYRVTAQTIIPGILEKDQDQLIVYGSNDFGKTVVDDERYSKLLAESADALRIRPHKVIGKDNKVIKLMSSVDCKGIIGNDNRTYLLDLLNIFPPDINYFRNAPKEVRPVLSERMQKLGYPYAHPHLLSCLRQELVETFCELKTEEFIIHVMDEFLKLKPDSVLDQEANEETGVEAGANGNTDPVVSAADDSSTHTSNARENPLYFNRIRMQIKQAMIEGTDDPDLKKALETALERFPIFQDNYKILFNPDAYKTAITFAEEEKLNLEKDKNLINEICEFLVLEQIPAFIEDCAAFSVIPQDGKALVEILHQRGINVRYLSRIVEELTDKPVIGYLRNLAICEIVVRAAKHLFKIYMQDVDQIYLSAAVAHFLNCFFTTQTNLQPLKGVEDITPKAAKAKGGKKRGKNSNQNNTREMEWTNKTVSSLWSALNKEVNDYFHIDLELTNIDVFCKKNGLLKTTILRSFCQTVGIQLKLQEYFVKTSRSNLELFSVEDIIAINPVVKHLHPRSTEAHRVFTLGQKQISEGLLEEGLMTITEALNLFVAVYGPLHPDIGACNRILARLSYVMGLSKKAVIYQQHATLISERVYGIDHPSTSAEYTHLALYCFASEMYKPAFDLLCRARYLAVLCHGPHHPEIAQIDVNLALMLQLVKDFTTSVEFLTNAHSLNQQFYGEKSLKAAFTSHLLSLAHTYFGDFASSVRFEKARQKIYVERFGEDSEYVAETVSFLNFLLSRMSTANNLKKQSESGLMADRAEVTAALMQNFGRSPDASELVDIMNRVNGIFYVHFSKTSKNEVDDSDAVIEEPKVTVTVEEGPVNEDSEDNSTTSAVESPQYPVDKHDCT